MNRYLVLLPDLTQVEVGAAGWINLDGALVFQDTAEAPVRTFPAGEWNAVWPNVSPA